MMQTRKKNPLIPFIPLIPALITLLPELEGTAGTLPSAETSGLPRLYTLISGIFWDQSFRRCLECCDSLIFCWGFMQKAGELMGWNPLTIPHFLLRHFVIFSCCLSHFRTLIVCAQDWIRLTFNGVCTMPILPPGCIDEATPQ